jgi:hypothetical protein
MGKTYKDYSEYDNEYRNNKGKMRFKDKKKGREPKPRRTDLDDELEREKYPKIKHQEYEKYRD